MEERRRDTCCWRASDQGGKQTKISASQGRLLQLFGLINFTHLNFPTSSVALIPTFDLLSIQEADGASLVISLAEEKDEGKYVCQISTYKPTEIKHTVKIRGKLRLIYSVIESNRAFWNHVYCMPLN